jgi:class 3 adenylate cyclase
MGAEDYMPKPFNSMLLKARLNACLEKKRWRDQEQIYLQQLEVEREKSERLLLNILPKAIADRLKREETIIADSFEEITVLFADIDNFTRFSAQMLPEKVVELLNKIFSYFDRLALQYELEKVKTIGDAYMVVGGLNAPKINSATAIAEMALDMRKGVLQFKWENGKPLSMRIGIHTGPVVAGVIGKSKFSYDLWGDTVNIASRMESQGISGCIQVSERTYQYLKDKFIITPRGTIQIKGKGKIQTYLLEGKKQA